MRIEPLTPAIGARLSGLTLSSPMDAETAEAIYQALIVHQVIFIRGQEIKPAGHMALAESFGQLDEPHPLYPHVEGYDRIVHLENDADHPPDTNSWHTDLTFKAQQPFATILIARKTPLVGGDTMWSSNIAAYNRLPQGMKADLEGLKAVHDMGSFRNNFSADLNNLSGADRLNDAVARFGHQVRPLIGTHPVTGAKFLNFNESFVVHIDGMTTNESNALRGYLANHMNKPEDQVRWRWQDGDLAMWDNRVTMHYAVADYTPQYRSMNRITVINDRRV